METSGFGGGAALSNSSLPGRRGKTFSCRASSVCNCAAASLNFLYSTSWRISSQRGSSPSSSPSTCDLLVHRQQFAALDVHERRGHHEEFAGDLQVELPHQVDVFDELGGQLGEVDLVNVHLLLLDQIKKQIERAFKDLEFDFIFRHARQPMKNSKTTVPGLQCRKRVAAFEKWHGAIWGAGCRKQNGARTAMSA